MDHLSWFKVLISWASLGPQGLTIGDTSNRFSKTGTLSKWLTSVKMFTCRESSGTRSFWGPEDGSSEHENDHRYRKWYIFYSSFLRLLRYRNKIYGFYWKTLCLGPWGPNWDISFETFSKSMKLTNLMYPVKVLPCRDISRFPNIRVPLYTGIYSFLIKITNKISWFYSLFPKAFKCNTKWMYWWSCFLHFISRLAVFFLLMLWIFLKIWSAK